MNGFEIMSWLSTNLPAMSPMLSPVIGAVTGGLLTAIFLRHNTRVQEFEKVKAGFFQEVVNDLLANGTMSCTEYYKANNFLKIAKKADKYYAEHHHNPIPEEGKQYDFDWFLRFYESVGNISDEKMQELWARILAGEIEHPSSYSLRTLDTLRNMSKADAELFIEILQHSLGDNQAIGIPKDDVFLNNNNINYVQIMRLSEQGIMFDQAAIRQIQVTGTNRFVIFNDCYAVVAKTKDGSTRYITQNQYPFTTVGIELASLVHPVTPVSDFIYAAKNISKDNNFDVALYEIDNTGTRIKLKKEIPF